MAKKSPFQLLYDMTLDFAEALSPNKPNQLLYLVSIVVVPTASLIRLGQSIITPVGGYGGHQFCNDQEQIPSLNNSLGSLEVSANHMYETCTQGVNLSSNFEYFACIFI